MLRVVPRLASRANDELSRGREAMANQVAEFEAGQIRKKAPEFRVGDTVKVQVKVKEGDKERLQAFQGVVIARHSGGSRSTFTVRKVSGGVGVERVFPLHSPNVSQIDLVKRNKVKRAKLYYLRELRGKAARLREKREVVEA